MRPPIPLMVSYSLGVVLFVSGLVFILLNYLSITHLNAGIFLMSGFILTFGSGVIAKVIQKRSQL